MRQLKFILPLLLVALLVSCQYLRLDSSSGTFPLEEGTKWVYVDSVSGDTLTLIVDKKEKREVPVTYDCEAGVSYLGEKLYGYTIKAVTKDPDLIPFDFVVKDEDCYKFYYGWNIVIYDEFTTWRKNKSYERIPYSNTIFPPPDTCYISFVPNTGFIKIKISIITTSRRKIFNLKLIEFTKH